MACFGEGCDGGHTEIMTDVVDPQYIPFPVRTLSVIEKVPVEIFVSICGYLAPIWLYNLSHASKLTRTRLTGQEGNKIWYNALPICVWKESEKYQDEEELREWANPECQKPTNLNVSTRSMSRKLLGFSKIPIPIQNSTLKTNAVSTRRSVVQTATAFYPPATPSPVAGMHNLPSANNGSDALVSWTDKRAIGYDLSPIRTHFPSLFSGFEISQRKKVQAIGGQYEPFFNYKREILGYLRTSRRCFVCLSIKTSLDSAVTCRRWGMLWCSHCIAEYTIASTVLDDVENGDLIMESAGLQAFRQNRRDMFYRPEIDDLIRHQFGVDLKTILQVDAHCKQVMAKQRLQRSKLELDRRIIRRKLVYIAKMIWEGLDPNPNILMSEDGVVSYHASSKLVSPETYRTFRERFAPTAELEKFLFPDYLVVDNPYYQTTYNGDSGWLYDPSTIIDKNKSLGDIPHGWYCEQAARMLHQLTNSRQRNYYLKGYGGYVDAWVKAGTKYHLNRLKAEIDSGVTVSLAHTPVQFHNSDEFDRIRKLRAKCGLQTEGYGMMSPLPQRVDVNDFSSECSFEEYLELNRVAAVAEDDRRTKIKYFNKIIRHTCVGCPITGGLFYPMGLEGLLEHMRTAHPREFWETDDFHVIG